MSPKEFYSPDEVAEMLDLHVRTVRQFIRAGKLNATRIGKQYRIAAGDLSEFVGSDVTTPPRTRSVRVSTIVDVDAIDPTESQRVSTAITAMVHGERKGHTVNCIYYEQQGQMRIVINANIGATQTLLRMIEAILEDANDN